MAPVLRLTAKTATCYNRRALRSRPRLGGKAVRRTRNQAPRAQPKGNMPIFSDTEQFYACMRAVFARMGQDDPSAGKAISRAGLILRLTLHDPPAQITIDGRHNPLQISYGPSSLRPDLEVALSSDTLHKILLGQLNGMSALGAGLLTVRGPVLRALMLGDLFGHLQAVYPGVLREQGLA